MPEGPVASSGHAALRAAFSALIDVGDARGTAAVLQGLDESTRRAIGKDVCALSRDHASQLRRPQADAVQVALAGVATLPELVKIGRVLGPYGTLEAQVLVDRAPSWLGDLCAWLLEGDAADQTASHWPFVRGFVRHRLIPAPSTHAYLAGMVRSARGFPGRERQPDGSWIDSPAPLGRAAAGLLRTDPELLERELWMLFEIEDESSALNESARFYSAESQWPQGILELTAEGAIDRLRLLDAILFALASDWQPHHCTWFMRLWADLEPTEEERDARRAGLELLLAASAPPVVGFATDELYGLAKRGALEATVIPHLAPALAAPAKRTANRAIAILDVLVKAEPGCRCAAALAATEALVSADADVQRKALDRVARWRPAPRAEDGSAIPNAVDSAIEQALHRASPGLSLTLRDELGALLGASKGSDGAGGGAEGTVASASIAEHPERSDLEQRIAALPDHIRSALALDCATVHRTAPPMPSAPVPGEPVLDPAQAIAPIATLDELSDALGALVYDLDGWVGTQLEIERIADAVLRWCGDRTPFDGPLRPRVKKISERGAHGWGHNPMRLAEAWRAQEIPKRVDNGQPSRRFDCALEHARAGRTHPTLALPTHSGGWIDPLVLVDRIQAIIDAGHVIDDLELSQAFLRTAPDGLADALLQAESVQGKEGELLRAALGGPPARGRSQAARAASAVRPENAAPAATVHASREGQYRMHLDFRIAGLSEHRQLTVANELEGPFERGGSSGRAAEPPGALALAWPAARTIAHAREAGDAVYDLCAGGADGVQRLETLRLLLSDREPIEAVAAQHLAWGLASGREERYLLAVDIAIAAIADGRLDASLLGPAFAAGLQAEILIPGRVGARLQTVAGASELHRAVARDTVDLALGLTTAPRNIAAILTPFDEWCAATNTRVFHEPTRAFLATLTGGSKAARAARSLLARAGERPPREAALLTQARLRRAERWVQLQR